MRDLKDLFRTLSKLINLALDSHFFNGILDFFDINHALIGEGMEEVECLDGLLSSLFVPENEIDPFMEVL